MKNCKQLVGVRVLRPALGQLAPRKARLPLPHKDLGRQRPFLMMPSQRNGTRVLKSELLEIHVQAASHWGGQELESLRGAAGVLLRQVFPRARVWVGVWGHPGDRLVQLEAVQALSGPSGQGCARVVRC